MKMDEGAGNEHDYNDDHDLAHTAKIMNSKSVMTQSLNTMGLTVMMLNYLFLIVNQWRGMGMLPTLCAEATGAVACSQSHPVTQPSSMFGLRSCTLSASLPLTV